MSGELSPERAVRLLRAKAADLEAAALEVEHHHDGVCAADLAADIALIAGLLADFMEWAGPTLRLYEAHTENLIERMARVDQHLWPEEWEL